MFSRWAGFWLQYALTLKACQWLAHMIQVGDDDVLTAILVIMTGGPSPRHALIAIWTLIASSRCWWPAVAICAAPNWFSRNVPVFSEGRTPHVSGGEEIKLVLRWTTRTDFEWVADGKYSFTSQESWSYPACLCLGHICWWDGQSAGS